MSTTAYQFYNKETPCSLLALLPDHKESPQEFIEAFLPNYYQSNEVMELNVLYCLIESESLEKSEVHHNRINELTSQLTHLALENFYDCTRNGTVRMKRLCNVQSTEDAITAYQSGTPLFYVHEAEESKLCHINSEQVIYNHAADRIFYTSSY